MQEINIKYQVVLFGSFEDISPSPDNLKYLIDAFADKELIPSTFQEIEAGGLTLSLGLGVPAAGEGIVNRFGLRSSDGAWNIEFGSARINIVNVNKDIGVTAMGSLAEFVAVAMDSVQKIVDRFPKKFHRISLVSTRAFKDLSEEEMSKAYLSVINPLSIFEENPPIDWHCRTATRLDFQVRETEATNVISELRRMDGQLKENSEIRDVKGLTVNIDINTFQGNTEYRFDQVDVKAFLDNAVHLDARLLDEYRKRIV